MLPRAALLACLAAAPGLAHAQRIDGVIQPEGNAAAGEGGPMVEVNPGGIAFGPRLDLTYLFADSRLDAPAEGHAAFLGVGFLSPYHTALGLQFLDDPRFEGSPTKISWGHALRLSDAASVGFTWHTFVSDHSRALDGFDTWDAGFQVRPWRWMATGFAVTDLTTPLLAGEPVSRGYEAAVAVRPGLERLTLTARVRLVEDEVSDSEIGGLLKWRMFGRFGLIGRYDTWEAAGQRAHRVLVGLADLGRFGLGVFGYGPDVAAEDGAVGVAISASVRSETEPLPALLPRPTVVEVSVESATEYGPRGFFNRNPATPFLDLLLTLQALERDEDVSAVLLSFGDVALGWAQSEELHAAVKRLRAADKKVYVWLPVADTRTYMIASAADRVYTAPAGGLLLTGIRAEMLYLGQLLENLKVNAQFVAMRDYKTAPEMFTRTDPSPAARQVEDALLDDLYARVVGRIGEGRGFAREKVLEIIDRGPYTAAAAREAGLIDGVIHYDEFEKVMRDAFGRGVRFTPAREWLAGRDPRWGELPAVGLLYVVGTITDGDSVVNPFTGAASTGADTFVRATRALRDDPTVRAVVLRVDSPGGSVTAADAMWRELARLAEVKPLVVSMGNIAASGGYYVAAPAQEILASPDTITGSIGVFTGKFDLSGLLGLVGIHREVFTRGARADLLSTSTSWDEDQLAAVRDAMEALYDLFLERVAEGRENLDKEQVAPLARGRVWTGAQARACGLVDRPAGFLTAIDIAASEAGLGIGDYDFRVLPLTEGFGGLPRAPVLGPLDELARLLLPAPAPVAELPLPPALRTALSVPALQFPSGTPLALLPVTFVH